MNKPKSTKDPRYLLEQLTIAEAIGLSVSSVAKIERIALLKLRHGLRQRGYSLEDFLYLENLK